MRLVPLALALACIVSALPQRAYAAAGVSVRAILITATNEKREADPKLRPYEAELQRNMPLSSFRHVGEGNTSVAAGGQGSIGLGRGHKIDVEAEKGGNRLKVNWTGGGRTVMDTTVSFNPGVPVVLVRRPSDDDKETLIVLLIAK